MKIGILTFHWATNYGAVLQAYALQEYLEKKGHSVMIVNYKPSKFDWTIKKYFIAPRSLRYLFRDIKQKIKDNKINEFRQKYLHLTRIYHTTSDVAKAKADYDVLISGSDQVLNPMFTMAGEGKPTQVYYLPFEKVSKRIGYAISFGCVDYPAEAKKYAAQWINYFSSIGVREDTGLSVLKQLGYDKEQEVVPDPTILLGRELFVKIIPTRLHSNGRICVYMLRHRVLLPIPNVIYIDEGSNSYTMEEWLGIITTSTGLVTNSYHGMIMAILSHVPFVVMLEKGAHSGMNDRFYTLLSRLNLTSRIKESGEDCQKLLSMEINWAEIDIRLEEFRKEGEEYLSKHFSN